MKTKKFDPANYNVIRADYMNGAIDRKTFLRLTGQSDRKPKKKA